jgi:hypothetical protein
VPGAIVLPDSTKPTPGFRFQGGFDFWGFHVWSAVSVTLASGASTGCSGFFYMQTLKLGHALSVSGDGNNPPPTEVASRMQAANFPSGGAYFSFDTAGPDYLQASWVVNLFDWNRETVDVKVDTSGFTFTVHSQIADIVTSDVTCVLGNDWQTLSITCDGYLQGSLQLPVVVAVALGDVATGKGDDVTINATYTANLTVTRSGEDVEIKAGCNFTFANDTRVWVLPPVDIQLSSLNQLAEQLLVEIGNQAESIFLDAIEGAGKLIVKYLDKTWDDVEKEAAALYGDIVHTIGVIFGMHQKKRPQIPWLQDGALVAVSGAQVTTDPADPNYDQYAIYVVQGLQRYHVPDGPTLTFLQNKGAATYGAGSDGFSPDYVITIPLPDPAVEYPSVQDGTLYWRLGDPPMTLTMVISYPDKSGDPTPAHYEIQGDGAAFLAKVQGWGFNPTVLKLPCDPHDINRFDESQLDELCFISADGRATAVFNDGARANIPGATADTADGNLKMKSYTISPSAYDAIPVQPAQSD